MRLAAGLYHPHPGARRGLFHYYRIPLEVYIINVQSYTLLHQTTATLTKGQKDFGGYIADLQAMFDSVERFYED